METGKREHGNYPPDLGGYQFRHEALREKVRYHFMEGRSVVFYWLGDGTGMYSYRAGEGFGYFED